MKLADFLKLAKDRGFLAADKNPADLEAAIVAQLAQDKTAADAEAKEATDKAMDKRAADRKARDEKRAADRKARDEKRAADRKARDEKRAADRKARDEKFGEDSGEDPEGTNDAEMKSEAEDEEKDEREAEDSDNPEPESGTPSKGGPNKKPAVDSATVTKLIADAIAKDRAERESLFTARREVEPILGAVTMDSAAAVYRAALVKVGVDAKGVDDSALPALLKLAKGRAAMPADPRLGTDAESVAEVRKLIPNYNRL